MSSLFFLSAEYLNDLGICIAINDFDLVLASLLGFKSRNLGGLSLALLIAKRKFSVKFEKNWSKNKTSIVLTQVIKNFTKPQMLVVQVITGGHYTVPVAVILDIPIINISKG